jgi:hypothetical protein
MASASGSEPNCCSAAGSNTALQLCNSYNVLGASVSKTYARSGSTYRKNKDKEEHSMMDVILLGLVVCFFALAIGYAHACDRL